MGGLVALYAGVVRSDMFSRVRFYLDVGTLERSRAIEPMAADEHGAGLTYPRAYREGVEAAAAALRANGVADRKIRLVVAAGAEHNEKA